MLTRLHRIPLPASGGMGRLEAVQSELAENRVDGPAIGLEEGVRKVAVESGGSDGQPHARNDTGRGAYLVPAVRRCRRAASITHAC